MKKSIAGLSLTLLAGCFSSTAAICGSVPDDRRLEIYKFKAPVSMNEDVSVRDRVRAGTVLGNNGIDAYIVVLRLEPGERFLSARVRMRDGFVCRRRKNAYGWTTGKVLSTIGYQIALGEIPAQLQPGLSLLGRLITREPDPGRSAPPKLQAKLLLRSKDVDHGRGYVTAFLPLAAGSLTRIEMTSIVTERPSRRGKWKRSRSRALPMLVPGPDDPGIGREELLRMIVSHDPR